jgi:hypothetical protein
LCCFPSPNPCQHYSYQLEATKELSAIACRAGTLSRATGGRADDTCRHARDAIGDGRDEGKDQLTPTMSRDLAMLAQKTGTASARRKRPLIADGTAIERAQRPASTTRSGGGCATGLPKKLIVRDTRSDPTKAVNEVAELNQPGSCHHLGPTSSLGTGRPPQQPVAVRLRGE